MEIVVPDLGDVHEIKLIRWLADASGLVNAGAPLAELEADKVVFVVEAPSAGRVRPSVGPGASVRAGQSLGQLEAC